MGGLSPPPSRRSAVLIKGLFTELWYNWFFHLWQTVQQLSGGSVTSVSTSDAALTIAPTTGAVIVSANNFTAGAHGVVPASGGGVVNFLRADGTWAVPAGGAATVSLADPLMLMGA